MTAKPLGAGPFESPEVRAQALYLNEGGWHRCKNNHWHDQEPGDECMECGDPAVAERRPDRGSRFEAFYAAYVAKQKAGAA